MNSLGNIHVGVKEFGFLTWLITKNTTWVQIPPPPLVSKLKERRMTGRQLLAILKQLPSDELDLDVAFRCTENNLEGHRTVSIIQTVPADFGKLLLLLPE